MNNLTRIDLALTEWETRIAAMDAVEVMDALDLTKLTTARAHQFVSVEFPETVNTGEYRDAAAARVTDTVTLQTAFRIRKGEQKTSRREAYAWTASLTAHVCDYAFRPEWQIHFVSEQRARVGEWVTSTQTYTMRRDQRLMSTE